MPEPTIVREPASGAAAPGDSRRAAAPPGSTAARRRGAVWAIRLLLLAALLALWQWYGVRSGGVFVPSLTQTLGRLPGLVGSGTVPHALAVSNLALLVGYPVAAVFGTALGFLVGRRRTADRALSYWVDIAMVVPMVAIVPVVIVALGLTLTARVAVVVLFALPAIALNARAAVRVIDHDLVEMAHSFDANTRQTWTSVILPAAFAQLFTGLRIGIGRAISGMVIVELTLVPAGLGGLLLDYRSSFAGSDLYAVTLVVVAEGVLLTALGHLLERRLAGRMRGGTR